VTRRALPGCLSCTLLIGSAINAILGAGDIENRSILQGFLRIVISLAIAIPILWQMNRVAAGRTRLNTETFSAILSVFLATLLLAVFAKSIAHWYHERNIQGALLAVAVALGVPLALYLFLHVLRAGFDVWTTPPGEYMRRLRDLRESLKEHDRSQ
jgi:predicted neutral ceramidase superfamily lipid hydrolase